MMNYESAYPGLGGIDDAIRDTRRQELLFLSDLCKHIEWPSCNNAEKCQKPNQMQMPDVCVLINENDFITFPIPIITVEIIGKKDIWGKGEREYSSCRSTLRSIPPQSLQCR